MIEYEHLARSNALWMAELQEAARRVIASGWYVLGQEVQAFEQDFAAYVGAKHCIGVGNGLDALVLALECLQLPPRSEVLVASNTYIATILAIVQAGHVPVLVEPNLQTYNIDPALLGAALTRNTRAICVTHLYGKSCRMDAIGAFAREHGLRIVEDCAQSHGARIGATMTGRFGDLGCFSFYPTKNLGALGDAGALVTDDDDLADRLRHLRNYGSREKYVHRYVGSNSRLDELQAALLCVKLRHLNTVTDHKRALASVYFDRLPGSVVLPATAPDEYDVHHIFPVRHPERDALRAHLLAHGIKTEIHYPTTPHRQEAMQGILAGDYPLADEIHRTVLSLPISFGHTPSDIAQVCDAVLAFGFERA